jgi:hypothetical protein
VERPVMAYRANRITYFGLANLICHTEIMTQSDRVCHRVPAP